MKKLLIVIVTVFSSGFAMLHAGGIESLEVSFSELSTVKLSKIQQGDIYIPAPSAVMPGSASRKTGPQADADAVINSLTDAQWNLILNSQPWESSDDPGISKGLYSNYHTRYIVKGKISFNTNPPTFITETDKIFIVTKYPKWLKKVGDVTICVEGYAKQQDDTSEFVIKKMLPLSAFDESVPSAEIRDMERDPYIISHNSASYELGNVSWNLAHSDDGKKLTDSYGNFVTVWQTGVVVRPELLESAYFVKKVMHKPVKYANHGLLMFKFKPGGVVSPDGQQSHGIAVSMDVYHKDPAHMSNSVKEAFKGKYLVYYSVQTIERYTEFKISNTDAVGLPETLILYPLAIDRGQQLQLLDNVIRKATDNHVGERYSPLDNSCTNAILSLINGVLNDDQKIKSGWLPEIIYRFRTTLPDAVAALLIKKGITGKPLPKVTAANYQHAYDF